MEIEIKDIKAIKEKAKISNPNLVVTLNVLVDSKERRVHIPAREIDYYSLEALKEVVAFRIERGFYT